MMHASTSRSLFRVMLLALLAATVVACATVDRSDPRFPSVRGVEPIRYEVHLHQPETQTVDIRMVIPNVRERSLHISLPTWRPGRYAIEDFAGTVRWIRASNTAGDSLAIRKLDKATWEIDPAGSRTVLVEYQLYANALGNRTRHVDDTHAYLSGTSVFTYVPNRRLHPIEVEVFAPETWRTATGLPAHPEKANTFTAPNYDVLADSPLEIGMQEFIEFDVDGVPHEIAIWGEGDYDLEEMAADFTEIIREQWAIFGELPYERYVFLIHVRPGAGGGTEHLNSTIMQTTPNTFRSRAGYVRYLRLAAHEIFHTWNVKQFRPSGLSPYDYQNENYTRLLWVAEGSTSYYDDLTLVRTGQNTVSAYVRGLESSIVSELNRPGRLLQSLEESSFDAWIKFNRPTPDSSNTTVSFYSKGALVNLMLDMEIRRRSNGRHSLDDLMRLLYERFPLHSSGFRPEDVVRLASELAGEPMDAFFRNYVSGVAEIDRTMARALETVGIEMYFDGEEHGRGGEWLDAFVQRPHLGMTVATRSGRPTISGISGEGPAWGSGVMSGDVILSINGTEIEDTDAANELLGSLEPGSRLRMRVERRGEARDVAMTVDGRPDGRWRVRWAADPSPEQIAMFESWTRQPWPNDDAS